MMAVGDAEVVEAAVGRSVVLTVGMTTMGEREVDVSGTAGSRAGEDGAGDEMGSQDRKGPKQDDGDCPT